MFTLMTLTVTTSLLVLALCSARICRRFLSRSLKDLLYVITVSASLLATAHYCPKPSFSTLQELYELLLEIVETPAVRVGALTALVMVGLVCLYHLTDQKY